MNSEDALYPCSFVIFGATGHLAATKLLPALYRLELEKRLPDITNFVAFARRQWDDAAWKAHMQQMLRPNLGAQFTTECFDRFAARPRETTTRPASSSAAKEAATATR